MVSARSMAAAALVAVAVLASGGAAVAADPEPPHRIKSNGRTFFDTVTRQEFLPRGANYIRLAGNPDEPWHSTFEPGIYSPQNVETMLYFLKWRSGYNTVRVFVDSGGVGLGHGIGANPVGPHGLRLAYLDNLEHFIRRAAAYGIYVMLSADSVPYNPYFDAVRNTVNNGQIYQDASGHNAHYLDHGWVVTKQAYLQNLAGELGRRLGNMRTAIFAYATDNEVFFRTNERPFSQGLGFIYRLRHVPGSAYNMGSWYERQRLLEDGLLHYANAAVHAVNTLANDPDVMVTVGFGTNFAVGKAGQVGLPVRCPSETCVPSPKFQYWYPGNPADLANRSAVHFVDMHVYPLSGGYTLAADLGSSGIGAIPKPYMLGEFGAPKAAYPNIYAAADNMRLKQIQSCAIGNGAKGWLFWTYDTDLVQPGMGQQGQFYSLLSPDGSGVINGVLAPLVRNHPCA